MSASSKGADRERHLKKMLEADGWVVVRCAGSKSAVDLWAMRRTPVAESRPMSSILTLAGTLSEAMAIQVKGNTGSPWMNFRREERAELGLIAAKAGASAWLVHWPPHGECRWYAESEWPEARVAA